MASLTDTAPNTAPKIGSKPKSSLRQWLYLDLAIVGTALPLWIFARYLSSGDITPARFISDAFANGVAALLTTDVLISSVAFWFLAAHEMSKMGTGKGKLPLFMVLNLGIGLSSALPAFMWWRERQLSKHAAEA